MKALDRKLFRDLERLKGQVITIAVVVACGIAQLVAFVTLYKSLEASRDVFFSQTRFGDLFDHLDRAPRSVLARLAEIPGVARADGRVVGDFRIELPGVTDPLLGRFVSLDGEAETRLDTLILKEGRTVEPGSGPEVVVSELFAHTHALHPGDPLVAVLNGREVRLRIAGVGLSPEYIYVANPNTGFVDDEHFGIFWMDGNAVADAMGLDGAFNDLVISFTAAAEPSDVLSAVDRVLEPYGGTGAILREHQLSAQTLDLKIAQYRSMARTVPVFFLAVAAFLLNMVLSRIVGTQREQIATLKALGYSSGVLSRHYLSMALVVCGLGGVGGVALGMAEGVGALHALIKFFNLPLLSFRPDFGSAAIGIVASFAAGMLGAFSAVRRTVRLPAAEAMQPEPPESFKPTFIERLRFDRVLGVAGRMVLRDIERHPWRLLFSSMAVAMATAIQLVGLTFIDSLNRVIWIQFTQVETEDLALAFDRPRSAETVRELLHIPGVLLAEPERSIPVRMKAGWHERELAIVGLPPDSQLRRLQDAGGRPFRLVPGGLMLSRPLAKMLAVQSGDEVEVDVLEAGRKQLVIPVAGFVDDFTGLSAYMDLGELERRIGQPPTTSGALVAVDRSDLPAILRRLERLPAVGSFSQPELDRQNFERQITGSLRAMMVLLAFFAGIIAVGMVFNNARIALAVRSRDLATLRILGFTRSEVATVLLGEQAVQLVLGVLLGLPLGFLLGAAALGAVPPDLFRVPAVLTAGSAIASAAVVLVAGFGCALYVRREADRLDLVSVLKARD